MMFKRFILTQNNILWDLAQEIRKQRRTRRRLEHCLSKASLREGSGVRKIVFLISEQSKIATAIYAGSRKFYSALVC